MTTIGLGAARSPAAQLSLGPILPNWDAATRRDFYFRMADEAPVDIVYLGEVTCSKRTPFFEKELPEIAERLGRAGKQIVYSTLALVMNAREVAALREMAAEPGLLVEFNDLSGADLVAGRPHVIGPFVNVYNEATLAYLAGRGAIRVVLPAELPKPSIAALRQASPDLALEVQAFGRLPLALSARCYHARAHGLHKDGCQYVCALDQDGLPVTTLDGDGFLAVNGTMTLSYRYLNALGELGDLERQGASIFRLWPHTIDMVTVARTFRDVLDGRRERDAAEADILALMPEGWFSSTIYDGSGEPAG